MPCRPKHSGTLRIVFRYGYSKAHHINPWRPPGTAIVYRYGQNCFLRLGTRQLTRVPISQLSSPYHTSSPATDEIEFAFLPKKHYATAVMEECTSANCHSRKTHVSANAMPAQHNLRKISPWVPWPVLHSFLSGTTWATYGHVQVCDGCVEQFRQSSFCRRSGLRTYRPCGRVGRILFQKNLTVVPAL